MRAYLLLLLLLLFGCMQPGQPTSGENVSVNGTNTTVTMNVSVGMPNATAAANVSTGIPNVTATKNISGLEPNMTDTIITTPDNSCVSQPTDTEHMDIFDSHTHKPPTVSASLMISEMNAGGVSMANMYIDAPASLKTMSQYPGRFTAFVDTPESPEPTTWVTDGQAFVTSAEEQLKTGKYSGIGETDLRLSGQNHLTGEYESTPDISVPADNPIWLELVDLAAKYDVPISFHFVPEDAVANAAFEKMLKHNKNATLLWCHLGFNSMTLNSTALNDYLLQNPNLYFDTAGIQNMQAPLPQYTSNWWLLVNKSNNGQLNGEWRQFFETWNARILFGTDAGGGNGLPRWLNYVNNTSDGVPPDAIGHWRHLFGNLEYNTARNILNGNARVLFLKEQKLPYTYSVTSDRNCYPVSISSNSSVSALAFNQGARALTFTVADSIGANGSATISIPKALGGNFTASVDGQSIQTKEVSNSTHTIINIEYAGGIRTVVLSAIARTSPSG